MIFSFIDDLLPSAPWVRTNTTLQPYDENSSKQETRPSDINRMPIHDNPRVERQLMFGTVAAPRLTLIHFLDIAIEEPVLIC
jgi:hypothetical protein